MDLASLKKHQSCIIIAVILLFMGIAFVLRMIPAFFIKDPGFLYVYDTDSWYTLRQIEVMVRDFPQYTWFDPMTAYPTGKIIDWGPLYPFIAATLCLITGATTRSAIVFTSGWVAPLMAMIMVPLMFQLGKTVGNWKTGIIAAGLISVVSVQYFSFSSYGWVDHHIGEVLFSTLFFLGYISALFYVKAHPLNLKEGKSLIFPMILSTMTGILFFLAILTSTTVILTLVVIAIFTFVQYIIDYFHEHNSSYLPVVNGVLFTVSIIFLFIFGFKSEGLSITRYSIGIPYILLALIAETVVLFILSSLFQGKKITYLISLVVLSAGSFILIQIYPPLQTLSQQATSLFFGSSEYSVSVVETLPWTLSGAWENFNGALVLMAAGLLVVGYYAVKKREIQYIFVLVWSLVMLLVTIRFQRFAYFFTVNVVLLSAICIAEPLTWRKSSLARYWSAVLSRFSKSPESPIDKGSDASKKNPATTKRDKKRAAKHPVKKLFLSTDTMKTFTILIIVLLTIGLIVFSAAQEIKYGLNTPHNEISRDWIESLEWMQSDTPQTGVDYYKSYNAKGFTYPAESYGIMALWDAGHWITFFAHRIPITNPFQDHLGGSEGTAAFFLNLNESNADNILQKLGGKYIITDSNMAIDTFTNLVPWQSNSVDISPYIKYFLKSDPIDLTKLKIIHKFDDDYFQTMVVRLHNFDGSMTFPGTVDYIQYKIRQTTPSETSDVTGYARVITNERSINASNLDTTTPLTKEGPELLPTQYANIFSDLPNLPVQKVPALQHYRLVHESMENASVIPFPESDPVILSGIKYVKIFEFVKGAQIHGEGIIELPVVTNTGRTFVYRQESENGMFIVPYPTRGSLYGVRAVAEYHIVGSSRYITVTENDVTKGNRIAG
ncbi:MAG: oligosaccharyl transferase, archaeosortase A system-associated [Methanoregula sp.]|nr:oligosaccharyl transferase, archaeosortase A system-associated [Methanoregula sp.]